MTFVIFLKSETKQFAERIDTTMITKDTTIEEMIQLDTQFKSLAHRYDLNDMSLTIAQLELDMKLNSQFFLELIDIFANDKQFSITSLKSFEIPVILEYLSRTHRYYLDKKLPEMENLTFELAKGVDKSMNELLYFFFLKFSTELKKHIEYEENIVFPYILKLNQGLAPDTDRNAFRLKKFLNFHNHDIEDQLGDFRLHLETTFKELQDSLAFNLFCQHTTSFEKDLKIHALIEDDVLMPKALEMEKKHVGS